MSINFDKVCRLCMISTRSMMSLFEDESHNLPKKIMVLIPTLKIYAGDNLPSQICQGCVDQINNFDNFKLQCENSDVELNKYLNNQEEETENAENNETWTPSQDDVMSEASISNERMDEKDELQNGCKVEEELDNEMYPEVKEENNTEEYKYEVAISEPDVKFSVLNESQLKDDALKAKKLLHTKTTEPSGKVNESCSICGKLLAKKRYNEHLRRHSAGRPYKCDECGKTFGLKDSLKKHSLVHSGIKVHMCDICGKRFKLLSTLKLHHVTHTGQKSHVCEVCGKGFSQLGSFKTHKLLHLGVKPFSCGICGKSYSQKNTLQIHLAVHAGQRQHVCELCGKGFLLKGHLQNHMVVHSGEKKFSCEVCGVSYTQSHNLKKHKKTRGHQSN